MNDLLETFSLLSDALLDDPLLALANAVIWLDPLWDSSDAEFAEHGDNIGVALEATRIAFPEVYIEVIARYRAGEDEEDISNFVCAELSKHDIYAEGLDELGYGIPMPAFGIELGDPDTYVQHENLIPLVKMFGIRPDEDGVTVIDTASELARALATSLDQQPDPQWGKVSCALQWMFGISGNTSLDWTYEMAGEVNPLGWDEILFAMEVINEARILLDSAKEGIDLLQTNPQMTQVFTKNLKLAKKALKNQKGTHNERRHQRLRLPLDWSSPVRSDAGTALPDPELLHVRGDAA